MFRVIGLSGKAGVGKDFVAKWIHSKIDNSMIVAFADQLKVNTLIQHSLLYEDVFEKKSKEVRKLLQQTGTEQGRNIHGQDIWLRYMETWMKLHHERMGITTFIITDCRFQNEVEFVKQFENSTSIRIIAPKRNEQRLMEEKSNEDSSILLHSSECSLDDKEDLFDYCLYNNPNEDIYRQLYRLLPKKVFPPTIYYEN